MGQGGESHTRVDSGRKTRAQRWGETEVPNRARWVVRQRGRQVRGRERHSHEETQQEVGAKDKDKPKETESEPELAERKDRAWPRWEAPAPTRRKGGSRAGAQEDGGRPAARQAARWPRGATGRQGPGRGRAGGGGGGGGGGRGGLPRPRASPAIAFISPRGTWPGQRRAPAPPRPRSQSTDPASLAPGQTFAHELCAGKDSTLVPGSPGPPGCGASQAPFPHPPLAGRGRRGWTSGAGPGPPRAPQHRPRQPIRNLQPPVPLPRSRASAAPGGRTGRAQKVDVAPAEPARRADCARVGRCSPAVSLPLPETPIFGLGTASRCPVAERLLRRPLGPRSRDSGCPPQKCQPSSRLEILAQPPGEGAGLPGWAPKVVWAGAGNSTERKALGSGSRRGAGWGAGGRASGVLESVWKL